MLFAKIWGNKLALHDKEVRENAIDGFAKQIEKEICETVLIGTHNEALIKMCRQKIYKIAEECKKEIETVTYMGYQATQAPNNHVMISKDGRCVLHAQGNKPKTKKELKKMIETYIELTKESVVSINN